MAIRGTASRRWGLGIVVLAALSLAGSATTNRAAAAEGEPAFCGRQTLHDYLTPLQRMPKLRERPYRRIAEPFFRGVRIGASGPSLAVGAGSAGYQFQWDRNPKWDITVNLAQVNAEGVVVLRIAERRLRTAAQRPAEVVEPHFGLPIRPGFYRTTLMIRTSSGRKVAKFGNYYRVVRPKIAASFVTDAATYRPGETVFARLDNRGAAFALFGEGFKVEGLQGETWGPLPEAPGPYTTGLQFVAPGTTSNHCLPFPIPTTLPPGRYRLAQETVITWPSLPGQHRPILTTEFEVTAAADMGA
jgi:hypothetical protein